MSSEKSDVEKRNEKKVEDDKMNEDEEKKESRKRKVDESKATDEKKVEEKVDGKDKEGDEEKPPKKAKVQESQEPSKEARNQGIIEEGLIYMFYRPRTQLEEVHSMEDVQRLYIVLVPKRLPEKEGDKKSDAPVNAAANAKVAADNAVESVNDAAASAVDKVNNAAGNTIDAASKVRDTAADAAAKVRDTAADDAAKVRDTAANAAVPELKARLIYIAKKKLPDVASHAKFSGQVETVCNASDIKTAIKDKNAPALREGEAPDHHNARPVGAGCYAIVSKSGTVHLAYALEQPEEIGEVQKAFNITKQGSFGLSIKNPQTPSPPGTLQSNAKYPEDLQKVFNGRNWLGPDPTALLDYEGIVILFIAESTDLHQTLGKAGDTVLQMTEMDHQEHLKQDDRIWEDLKLSKKAFPVEPLFDGEWK